MKFTIERSTLLKALSHVSRIVEKRNNVAILSNVVLSTDGEKLQLRASDLDIQVTEMVPARIEAGGATTVPAQLLHDIVRKLPEGAEVSLDNESDEHTMQLRSGRSRFKLQTLPEGDFPNIGFEDQGASAGAPVHSFELSGADLRKVLAKTAFAMSTEETRYYLNGVYLHAHSDDDGRQVLRAVATDGHRLARFQMDLPAGANGLPGMIVPRKTVDQIQKLIESDAATVRVEANATKIRVTFDDLVLVSKLIDGTFPDYQRVIPRNNDKLADLDSAELKSAVDRVATVSSERGRSIKLSLSASGAVLQVVTSDTGSATEEVDATYSSDPIDIGFNSKYLLDILNQVDSDDVRFELADSGSPAIVRGSDASVLYVLMPMRV